MEILITGKGYIGKDLGRKLEEEHGVKYLDRNEADFENDITEEFQINEEFDIVFHTVGLEPGTRSEQEYRQVHVDGTKNLLEAVGFGKIVYISALGAGRIDHPFMETKKEAEELVKEQENYTILRPSVVYGEENRSLERLPRILPVLVMPDFGGEIQPIHIDDFVEILAECVDSHDGEILEIAGPERMSVFQMFQRYYREKKSWAFQVPFPRPLIRAGMSIGHSLTGSSSLDPRNMSLLDGAVAEENDAERILDELKRVGIDN